MNISGNLHNNSLIPQSNLSLDEGELDMDCGVFRWFLNDGFLPKKALLISLNRSFFQLTYSLSIMLILATGNSH